MSEYLKNVYNPKLSSTGAVLFSHETELKGGAHLHLPPGTPALKSGVYLPEHFSGTHPFTRYIAGIFGETRPVIVTSNDQLKSSYQGGDVLSAHFTTAVVTGARAMGSSVEDRYELFNNKARFQEMVIDTLGAEFSTHPHLLQSGVRIKDLSRAVEQVMQPGDKKAVLRIADVEVAHGGGMGVRFVQSPKEIVEFLSGLNVLDGQERVQTEVLVERYIPNTFSPSTTFFLAPDGVTPLTVNSQILDNGSFVAGTNILPAEIAQMQGDLTSQGLKLAERMYKEGGRGFLGYDWIVTPEGLPIAVECNYRETGATIPEFTTQRAVSFAERPGYTNWIFVLSVLYNSACPDFATALEKLRDEKLLFEGAKADPTDLDLPRFIPLYGMQTEDFDVVVMWRKNGLPNEKAFDMINGVLVNLGSKRRVNVPKINI